MLYNHPHRLNIFHFWQGGEVLEEHCTIELHDGVATLEAKPDAQCWVNSQFVDKPSRLTQGQYQMPIMHKCILSLLHYALVYFHVLVSFHLSIFL